MAAEWWRRRSRKPGEPSIASFGRSVAKCLFEGSAETGWIHKAECLAHSVDRQHVSGVREDSVSMQQSLASNVMIHAAERFEQPIQLRPRDRHNPTELVRPKIGRLQIVENNPTNAFKHGCIDDLLRLGHPI